MRVNKNSALAYSLEFLKVIFLNNITLEIIVDYKSVLNSKVN